MSKVIVERPRRGRAVAGMRPGRTRTLVDDDGEPIRAKGAKEPRGRAQKTKWLNENLNPLKRYLAAQVGRPWRKVYSEISEHLKPTSTVQQHVRDHLVDFVAIKARSEKGVIWADTRWGRPMPLSDTNLLYYVHPRTGLLLKNEHRVTRTEAKRRERAAEQAELNARMRVIDAATQVHLFKGDWWEVKLAKIDTKIKHAPDGRMYAVEPLYRDVVHASKLSSMAAERLYGRSKVYAAAKRQLSKTEIKRLKLR